MKAKWTKKSIKLEAKKYETKSQFQANNSSAYQAARRFGMIARLFPKKMQKKSCVKWNRESVLKVLTTVKSRRQLKVLYNGAYLYALRTGMLSEAVVNLRPGFNKKGSFTLTQLEELASKYKTKKEFYNGNYNAYFFAYRHGLLGSLGPWKTAENN